MMTLLQKVGLIGALPVFTFLEEMHFYVHGNDTPILHVAPAHTDGDSIVDFNNVNVTHPGGCVSKWYLPVD